MQIRSILNIAFLLLCFSGTTFGQSKKSPIDFFNEASQQYIDNKKIDALKTIEEGLAEYKDDQKLLDLAEKLLKEEENKNNQQKQNQQQQQDKKKDQEQKDKQRNKDQNKENQDKKDQNQDKDKKENQDKQNDKKNEQKQGDKKEQEKQPMNPAQKNQALQDLKALENKEKALMKRLNIKKEKGKPVKSEKDW